MEIISFKTLIKNAFRAIIKPDKAFREIPDNQRVNYKIIVPLTLIWGVVFIFLNFAFAQGYWLFQWGHAPITLISQALFGFLLWFAGSILFFALSKLFKKKVPLKKIEIAVFYPWIVWAITPILDLPHLLFDIPMWNVFGAGAHLSWLFAFPFLALLSFFLLKDLLGFRKKELIFAGVLSFFVPFIGRFVFEEIPTFINNFLRFFDRSAGYPNCALLASFAVLIFFIFFRKFLLNQISLKKCVFASSFLIEAVMIVWLGLVYFTPFLDFPTGGKIVEISEIITGDFGIGSSWPKGGTVWTSSDYEGGTKTHRAGDDSAYYSDSYVDVVDMDFYPASGTINSISITVRMTSATQNNQSGVGPKAQACFAGDVTGAGTYYCGAWVENLSGASTRVFTISSSSIRTYSASGDGAAAGVTQWDALVAVMAKDNNDVLIHSWCQGDGNSNSDSGDQIAFDQVIVAVDYHLYPLVNQTHYRWRNDNGSESAATWKAAEDTAVTGQARNENARLRFSIKNVGGNVSGYAFRLQVAERTTTTCEVQTEGWLDVATTTGGCGTSIACMTSSSNFTNGDATTRQLSDPGLTWQAGKMLEDPSSETSAISLNQNYFTELEYNFQFTEYAEKDVAYCFRVLNGTSELNSYSKVATITMVSPVAPEVFQTHYLWRNDDGSEASSTWKTHDLETINQAKNENVRLRFSIKNGGTTASNYVYRLEMAAKTAATCEAQSTGWSAVATTTGGCGTAVACITTSSWFVNAASTTNQIPHPGSTFVAGQILEDPSYQSSAITLNQRYYTEIEYNFQFTNYAGGGDTYCFRVTNAGAALNTYSYVATITTLNSQPSTPTLADTPAFDNYNTADTTPILGNFSATDVDTDNVDYELQWSEDFNFATGVTTKNSSNYPTDAGWASSTFASGASVSYTVQAGDALTNGHTYWWRVRARDPLGSNTWSSYTAQRSLTITTSLALDQWFQTTDEQFDKDTLSDTVSNSPNDRVKLAGDWLSGYTYRKTVPITGSSGAGTGYQVKILVGESTGTAGTNVNVNGHSTTTTIFNDVRFTDNDGTTKLDYWLEGTSGSAPNRIGTFWVEVQDSLDASQSMFIYYGKAGDSSESSRVAAFPLFDDFNDGALDPKWSLAMAPYSYDEGVTTAGRLRMVSGKNTMCKNSQHNCQGVLQEVSGNFEMETLTYANPTKEMESSGLATQKDSNNFWALGYAAKWVIFTLKGIGALKEDNGSYSVFKEIVDDGSPKYIRVRRVGDNWSSWYHESGTETWTSITNWSQHIADPVQIGLAIQDGNANVNWPAEFDYFTFRRYASPEPSVGTPGSEQSSAVTVGTITSTKIDFDWVPNRRAWNQISWTEDETHGTVKVQVYYGSTCSSLVPNALIANNSTGVTSSPIDISGLDTTTYNELCLKATLNDVGGTPYLNDWTVKWPPIITPEVYQSHYRLRNDDGSESAATWKAAEDTSISSQARNQNLRIRFSIENNGLVATDYNYRLYWAQKGAYASCNAASPYVSWTAITTSTADTTIRMATSSNFTDQAASTNQLTQEGTFTAGKLAEYPSNQASSITLNQYYFTETEYNFQFGPNATTDTYCFRLANSATALDAYSQVAQISLGTHYPDCSTNNCYIESSTFDTQAASGGAYNSIMWKGTELTGTDVKLQIAVSSSPSGPFTFLGENCTQSSYYSPASNVQAEIKCYSNNNNKRYFRYKVFLYPDNNRDLAPTVNDVIVNWSP